MATVTDDRTADDVLKIVIVGHVDHGKSTLVGRLLHDTDSLPEGKYEAITEMCARRGVDFKWSFLMDALQRERDEGITVDTAQIRFRTATRGYVIIDAPGHKEFLKNMITGAANSDAALLLIDAHEGIREQTRRHGYLLHLLGVRQVIVAVNKMDLVGYCEARFRGIADNYSEYLTDLGLTPAAVIPIAAREGDNVADRSPKFGWYDGPTIVKALDGLVPPPPRTDLPFRLPIQDVYEYERRRVIVGRLESGRLGSGDPVTLLPSGGTARVATIERWQPSSNRPPEVLAGESVGITLDRDISVHRGQVMAEAGAPPLFANTIRARVFWLGRNPLAVGDSYQLRLNTARHEVEVIAIDRVIDVASLDVKAGAQVRTNDVAEVELRAQKPVILDPFAENPAMGRFVLQHGDDIVGGGIISANGGQRAPADQSTRAPGEILWLTGLSGAGKTTLARALEAPLRQRGRLVCVLDGDALRSGINSDLGFSPDDRAENVRRTGEIAALFADAGFVVIAALISPYRADRDRARALRPRRFHEIYIQSDIATCESRDPKGLYKAARAGDVPEFSGVSAPYEPPAAPDLLIDTATMSIEQSVDAVLAYLDGKTNVANSRAPNAVGNGEDAETAA